MPRYIARVYDANNDCIWGDNDILANNAEQARKRAEEAFLKPLDPRLIDTLPSEAEKEIVRDLEALRAEQRTQPYHVVASKSRAR